jgi:hypothetical protein
VGLTLCLYLQKVLNELPGLRLAPIVWPDHHPNEVALSVDDVGRGCPPYAPLFPGCLSALIEHDGSNIPPLLHGPPDQVGVLPDIHEENFETLALELTVDPVNGR